MFQKGKSGNAKGRPVGIKNHTSEEIRQLIRLFISENIEDIQNVYNALTPDKKLLFLERLLRFVLPKPLHDLELLSDAQLDEMIRRLKRDRDKDDSDDT
jgi:hypothetical protein